MILGKLADRYLRREVVRFVATCCLGFAAMFGAASFVAHRAGRPVLMAQLFGGDYPQFAMIGALQRDHGVGKLYDLDLQDDLLHRLVPSFPAELHLPFVYPPFVALAFRPIARLPFAASYAAWLVISAAAYVAALAIAFRASPAIRGADLVTAWLVALSFEPFAFECWIGGQLSAVGALGAALALTARRSGRPLVAGLALAALAYKPTLLVLIVPMLVAGREWRMLLGFAGGLFALGLVALAYAGPEPCREFAGLMAGYGRVGGSSGSIWNTRKYVDLGAALKLLGTPPTAARAISLMVSAPLVAALGLAWHRAARAGQDARDLAWAATLCATSVLNIYGPIYDVTVAVPGLIVAADVVRRRHPAGWPMGFSLIVASLYLGALASPVMALGLHLQPLTAALAVGGAYLVGASLADSAGWTRPGRGDAREIFRAIRRIEPRDRTNKG